MFNVIEDLSLLFTLISFVITSKDTSLNDEQMEYIDIITECGYSLMSIVNDVLDISKLNSDEIQIKNEDFNLRDCIESSFDIIRLNARNKNIDIGFNIDRKVPIFIKSDKQRIKQVLVNILNNAIKFTNKGSVKACVKVHSETEDKIKIIFEVTDTGRNV